MPARKGQHRVDPEESPGQNTSLQIPLKPRSPHVVFPLCVLFSPPARCQPVPSGAARTPFTIHALCPSISDGVWDYVPFSRMPTSSEAGATNWERKRGLSLPSLGPKEF